MLSRLFGSRKARVSPGGNSLFTTRSAEPSVNRGVNPGILSRVGSWIGNRTRKITGTRPINYARKGLRRQVDNAGISQTNLSAFVENPENICMDWKEKFLDEAGPVHSYAPARPPNAAPAPVGPMSIFDYVDVNMENDFKRMVGNITKSYNSLFIDITNEHMVTARHKELSDMADREGNHVYNVGKKSYDNAARNSNLNQLIVAATAADSRLEAAVNNTISDNTAHATEVAQRAADMGNGGNFDTIHEEAFNTFLNNVVDNSREVQEAKRRAIEANQRMESAKSTANMQRNKAITEYIDNILNEEDLRFLNEAEPGEQLVRDAKEKINGLVQVIRNMVKEMRDKRWDSMSAKDGILSAYVLGRLHNILTHLKNDEGFQRLLPKSDVVAKYIDKYIVEIDKFFEMVICPLLKNTVVKVVADQRRKEEEEADKERAIEVGRALAAIIPLKRQEIAARAAAEKVSSAARLRKAKEDRENAIERQRVAEEERLRGSVQRRVDTHAVRIANALQRQTNEQNRLDAPARIRPPRVPVNYSAIVNAATSRVAKNRANRKPLARNPALRPAAGSVANNEIFLQPPTSTAQNLISNLPPSSVAAPDAYRPRLFTEDEAIAFMAEAQEAALKIGRQLGPDQLARIKNGINPLNIAGGGKQPSRKSKSSRRSSRSRKSTSTRRR